PVAVEPQGGQGGQVALAVARVVPERAALERAPREPYGQLVADQHDLVALRGAARVLDGRTHALDLRAVRLAPRRAERVPQVRPVARVAQRAPAARDAQALEAVACLDDAVVGGQLEPEALGHRGGGLLRTLQRGGDHADDVAPRARQVL